MGTVSSLIYDTCWARGRSRTISSLFAVCNKSPLSFTQNVQKKLSNLK